MKPVSHCQDTSIDDIGANARASDVLHVNSLLCVGGLDVLNFNIEMQCLAGEGMIEVDHHGLFFHLRYFDRDGAAVGRFHHQRRAFFLRLDGDFFPGDIPGRLFRSASRNRLPA